MIRMPNDRYRNSHQTKTASAQEESGQNLPKIINCTTVRSSSMQYVASDSDYPIRANYEAVRSDAIGYPTQSHDKNPAFYPSIDVDCDDSNRAPRPTNHRFQEEFAAPNSGPSTSAQNMHSSRTTNQRIRDPQMFDNNPRNQLFHNSRGMPMMVQEPVNTHPSAFASFSSHHNNNSSHHMSNIHYQNDPQPPTSFSIVDRPPYPSSRQNLQMHNVHSESPGTSSRGNNYTGVAFPVPLPNNGTFIPNHNQQIVLPSYGPQDCVSGVLIVPIKKTCEMAIQTDESCLSRDYRPYHPAHNNASSVGVQFNGQKDLDSVIESTDSKRTSANCSVCFKDFLDSAHLRTHFEKYHSRDSLKCKDCGQVFQTAKNMQIHKARVHNKRMPFRCGVCGLRFEERSSVVQHLATHNASDKPASCETCGKKFRTEERLKRHSLKHKDMWHKCTDCGKSFGSVATLEYHSEQVHKRIKSGDMADGDITIVTPDSFMPLSEHQQPRLEAGESSSDEENDTATSNLEQPSCQLCQVSFKDAGELERHAVSCQLSVTSDRSSKMFRCAACQTFFATKPQLTNHYNTAHLTRDGYVCSKCPRKFRLWSKLKMHIKAFHFVKKISVLKFSCTVCPLKFATSLKLGEHMKKAHQIPAKQERIYTCKECKKRFRNLSSLMVHRRGVHELNILESPSTQTWECPYCNIERLTRKTYIAHLKEVHNLLVAEKGRSLEIIGKDASTGENVELVRTASSSSIDRNQNSGKNYSAVEGQAEVHPAQQLVPEKLFCQECGANFSEEKRLKNHLGLVHGQKPFSCEICQRKFSYSGQIVWHMRDHGRKEARKKRLKEKSAAGGIESAASNAADAVTKVAKPARAASDLRMCTHCGMNFPDEKRLNNHLGVRHGYKNFECDVCSQKFSYSTHLIWHRRSHFSEKKKEVSTRVQETDDSFVDVTGELPEGLQDEDNAEFAENGSLEGIGHGVESNPTVYLIPNHNATESMTKGEFNADLSEAGNDPETGLSGKEKVLANEDPNNRFSLQRNRYICGQCDAEFSEQDMFRDHMIKSHNAVVGRAGEEKVGVDQPPVSSPKNFTCEVCHKQLATYIGWKVHRTRVHRVTGDDKSGATVSPGQLKNVPAHVPFHVSAHVPAHVPTYAVTAPGTPFQNEELVELGSEDLNSPAVYSCSKCSRIFTGLRNLRTHQFKTHSIRSKDRGNAKGSVGSTPGELALFAKVQDGQIFQCGTCDYQFSSEKGRRIHCKKMGHTEHRRPPVPANDNVTIPSSGNDTMVYVTPSDDVFAQPPSPKRRKFDEDAEDVSPCEICHIEFHNFEELRNHFQEQHPAEMSFDMPNKQTGSYFGMEVDDKANTLSKSARAFTHANPIDCPKCDRTFPTRKGMNTHLLKFHKIKGAVFSKWMQDKDGFQHSATSASEGQFGFNDGSNAADAVPRNANLLPHHYKEPERGFTPTMVGLDINESEQNAEVRQVCSICQRSFLNRRGLTMHMARFHHLNKSELRKFNLDLDMIAEADFLSATGKEAEKPAKGLQKPLSFGEDCPLCEMKFPNRRSLGTHIFKRHGIRCKRLSPAERKALFSNRKLAAPSNDESHALNRSKLIAIECPICPGTFVGKRGVRAHVSRIHGLDKIELGFLFPEKHRTDDTAALTCKYCNRFFTNARIFAAHIYLVHKVDKLEMSEGITSDSASAILYHCSDLRCDEVFSSALELLVHVREKYGRNIGDGYAEAKTAQDDDLPGDYDYDDEFFEEDVADEEDVAAMEPDAYQGMGI